MPQAPRETELLHRLKVDLDQLVARHQALARQDFAGAAVCVSVRNRGAAALVAHPEGAASDQGVAMAMALLQPSSAAEQDACVRELLGQALELLARAQQLREASATKTSSLH